MSELGRPQQPRLQVETKYHDLKYPTCSLLRRSLLDIGRNVGSGLERLLELDNHRRKSSLHWVSSCCEGMIKETYRQGANALVIVDGLVDGKVGVGDLVAEEVGALAVGVVLRDQVVVVFQGLVVLGGTLGQLRRPVGLVALASSRLRREVETHSPVDVQVGNGVDDVLLLRSLTVVAAELSGKEAQDRDVLKG